MGGVFFHTAFGTLFGEEEKRKKILERHETKRTKETTDDLFVVSFARHSLSRALREEEEEVLLPFPFRYSKKKKKKTKKKDTT